MTASVPLTVLVLVGVGSPALLFALLASASLVDRPFPERWTGVLTGSSMAIACTALVMAFVVYGTTATGTQVLSYGAWSSSHEGGIGVEFLVDRLSLGFAALFVLCLAAIYGEHQSPFLYFQF